MAIDLQKLQLKFDALFEDENLVTGKWKNAGDSQPELIENENYSKNVWAVCNGQLSIMCYCYIPGEDGGYVWANCNGQIDGDAEFDDDYDVTHWMAFPSLPIIVL